MKLFIATAILLSTAFQTSHGRIAATQNGEEEVDASDNIFLLDESRNGCGALTPISKSECLSVSLALGGTAREGRLISGSWSWVPPGCSIQSGGDQAAHYNEYVPKNNGRYAPVCKATVYGWNGQENFRLLDSFQSGCDSRHAVSEAECLEAGMALGGIAKNGRLISGSWSDVPLGCSIGLMPENFVQPTWPWFQPDYYSKGGVYYNRGAVNDGGYSSVCRLGKDSFDVVTKDLIHAVDEAEDHTTEIETNIKKIDTFLDDINDDLGISKEINDELRKLDNTLSKAMNLLDTVKIVPMIRNVVSVTKLVMSNFRGAVKAAKTASDQIEYYASSVRKGITKIDAKVKVCDRKVLHLINRENDFIRMLYQAEKCRETLEASPLFDPEENPLKETMKIAADTLMPLVAEFDEYQSLLLGTVNSVKDSLSQGSMSVDRLASLQHDINSAIDAINPILSPLEDIQKALRQTITVPYGPPIPTDWCCEEVWGVCVMKYPCGWRTPTFSFTVMEILEGGLSVVGPVMDLLDEAMKAILNPLISALDLNINLPGIDVNVLNDVLASLPGLVDPADLMFETLDSDLDHPELSIFQENNEQYMQFLGQIQSVTDHCIKVGV